MPANFNHIARLYRYLEYLTLGPILQRTRTHFLSHLLDRKQALVLGDGDGRFLAQLLKTNLGIHADAVDTSATMLQLLRQRCETTVHSATHRLHTHNHSALEHAVSRKTDLITTHFFLDCLTQTELETLIAKLSSHLASGTLWLHSDFRIPTGLLNLPGRLYIRILYFAFRLLTGLRTTHLPDHEAPLQQAGFQRTHQHLSLFGLLTTELWERT
ncbi:class I SAM-dependent methyltransferase [Granulicella arctica]|uniref:class I SAM-dependent methyltransferase n=1 Tax=Granulicella arctica TaxID=940613 RepID=UPI0021E07772|nr:class I SAM-dependent methyltransferase [Granulicella arctica]